MAFVRRVQCVSFLVGVASLLIQFPRSCAHSDEGGLRSQVSVSQGISSNRMFQIL